MHPGGSTIYKLSRGGVSVVYATDFEPENADPNDLSRRRHCSERQSSENGDLFAGWTFEIGERGILYDEKARHSSFAGDAAGNVAG